MSSEKDIKSSRREGRRRGRYLDRPYNRYPFQMYPHSNPYYFMNSIYDPYYIAGQYYDTSNYYSLRPSFPNRSTPPPFYTSGVLPYSPNSVVPVVPQCQCSTSTIPFSLAHSIRGGVSNQGGQRCTPGDDRCFCYDTCNPSPYGDIGFDCSLNQKIPKDSACNYVPGIKTRKGY